MFSRSRASSALSDNTFDEFLYISGIGRSTGQRHVVKIRFIPWTTSSVCVLSSPVGSTTPDWLLNVLANSEDTTIVSKHLNGRVTMASFSLDSQDPEIQRRVADGFANKYGQDIFKHNSNYLGARPVILEFQDAPKKPHIIRELEFDIQAKRYTSLILKNPTARWQREAAVSNLLQLFKPGQTVLEIGCGTGIETVALAMRGIKVVALDISQTMLSVLDERARKARVSDMIRTRQLSSSQILDLRKDPVFQSGGFDGAFSDFGAANLEKDLGRFSNDLASLLKPRSKASFAVWNKFCATEVLVRFLKREKSLLQERFSGLVKASAKSRYSLDTFVYTPREFASKFIKEFEPLSVFSLPTMIPPPEYVAKATPLLRFRRADLALGRIPFFNMLGDNFVVTLRRRD